jgi:cellulose synthase/poly-beta-1,6-N-acetylglucosamine synthase-like glycosyltransferase
VVDDGSPPGTLEDVPAFDVRWVKLPQTQGPAAARNVGARECRGDILLFLDADVCVHRDTLERIVGDFTADTTLDAVFGSYDAKPTVRNLVSTYRNLMHHFFHQTAKEQATTFWAGCGAIRRSVFQQSGGFNATYSNPSVEDVDLGMRLRELGRRVRVNKCVLVTHQKHWTLWGLLKVDIFHRGVPWTRLLLQHRWIPNDLNLKWTQRIAAVLVWALVGTLTFGCWQYPWLLAGFLAGILSVAFLDPLSHKSAPAAALEWIVSGIVLSTFVTFGVLFGWWTLVPLVLALAIVGLNRWFYRFLARRRRLTFAMFVFPLHVVYYLCASIALAIGVAQHLWRRQRSVACQGGQMCVRNRDTTILRNDCGAGEKSPDVTARNVANEMP